MDTTTCETLKYDLLSDTPPPLPKKLPGFIRHTISKVPKYMHPAAANALFPPASALMTDVFFRFKDNTLHEPGSKMEGCVAKSSVGKGYLDPMCEAIVRSLLENDKVSRQKMQDYADLYNSLGENQKKPDRPKDAPILVVDSDMTNPAFLQLLMDAERAGNRSLYSFLSELDLLDLCCGSHRRVTQMVRLDYDSKRYGAHRATTKGVTGCPIVRWKFNFSCVPKKAVEFFKACMEDGTLGRIGFTYILKPLRKDTRARQGNYDEAYLSRLDEYLARLQAASGVIKVPKIDALVEKLDTVFGKYCDLADDDTFDALCKRAVGIGWQKGCLLYVAEGYRWTQEIADFVEWSVYNDLWSKVAIFSYLMKESQKVNLGDKRKNGPSNMLDMLSDNFTVEMLEKLREQMGKEKNATNQLSTWVDRGYIVYDGPSHLYVKTPMYLSTHPSIAHEKG